MDGVYLASTASERGRLRRLAAGGGDASPRNSVARVARNEYIQIDRRTLGAFNTTCDPDCYTNCYIITCPQTGDSLLVDAPGEAPEILKQLMGTNPDTY